VERCFPRLGIRRRLTSQSPASGAAPSGALESYPTVDLRAAHLIVKDCAVFEKERRRRGQLPVRLWTDRHGQPMYDPKRALLQSRFGTGNASPGAPGACLGPLHRGIGRAPRPPAPELLGEPTVIVTDDGLDWEGMTLQT
jgi:hypothetical protein